MICCIIYPENRRTATEDEDVSDDDDDEEEEDDRAGADFCGGGAHRDLDQFNTLKHRWKTVIMYFAKNILIIICSSPPGQVCRGATLSVRTNKKTIKFVFFVCFSRTIVFSVWCVGVCNDWIEK